MIRIDGGRLAAVARKEIREFRRSPFIIGSIAVFPLVFMINPLVVIFAIGATVKAATVQKAVGGTFLVLLIVPAVVPATIAAYSVVGEREQGTLEPLLSTPVRRLEILLGKALAAIVPSIAVAYLLFALVVLLARLFASNPTVVSTLTEGPHVLAEALFAPLLAGWSIAVGTAISTRASDVRIAQQLGALASLPPLAATALVSFQVITPSVGVALGFGFGLLAIDVVMWRVVATLFDRERLITGSRATRPPATGGGEPPGTVRRISMTGGTDGEPSDA
jgi:ABC-2 type transport system permease protein